MGSRFRSIFFNGLPWGLYFFALSYFVGAFLFRVPTKQLIIFSAVTFILAIICNGFIYRRFRLPTSQLDNVPVYLNATEKRIEECPAGYRIGDHLILGKLLLTDRRLVFQATELDRQDQARHSWVLGEITGKDFYPSFWNQGGVFSVVDLNGITHYFDVYKLKAFKQYFKNR